ncbi:MAG: cytochrome c peroxidase [Woeseiaceae bacterium]|nr:cytochrome c peroxidase [Woeseiaceae bacterium]
MKQKRQQGVRRLALAAGVALLVVGTGAQAGWNNGWWNNLPAPVADADYFANGNQDPAKVKLGQELFFDKVLSGNMNISCATCHHPLAGTGDGLALPVGEGGRGLGVTRDTGSGSDAVHERVPRNAPPVFNLGANEFSVMFHDGRIQPDAGMPSGFESPAGMDLPEGLDNALAVQAMFPVTSGTEMAGQPGENTIADVAAAGDLAGPNGVWAQLAERLRGIDGPGGYVEQFIAVFDDVNSADDIEYRHAANAIAAFEAVAWRADDSPFDRFLRGKRSAMSLNQIRGMRIFYSNRGNCSSCHSGKFQTDLNFYAIAMPQAGGGKGDGMFGYEDFGRERVTGNIADRYRFRTPTLRNIALTPPYGHAGTYDDLESAVRHHLNAVNSLYSYDISQLRVPPRPDLNAADAQAMNDPAVVDAIAARSEIAPRNLTDWEVARLIDFLNALTDPSMLDMRDDVPVQVPSGLTLAE